PGAGRSLGSSSLSVRRLGAHQDYWPEHGTAVEIWESPGDVAPEAQKPGAPVKGSKSFVSASGSYGTMTYGDLAVRNPFFRCFDLPRGKMLDLRRHKV